MFFKNADARLIEAVNLKTEEASLTGESVPAGKIPVYIQDGFGKDVCNPLRACLVEMDAVDGEDPAC